MAKQLELLILYPPKRLFKNASFFWCFFFLCDWLYYYEGYWDIITLYINQL